MFPRDRATPRPAMSFLGQRAGAKQKAPIKPDYAAIKLRVKATMAVFSEERQAQREKRNAAIETKMKEMQEAAAAPAAQEKSNA